MNPKVLYYLYFPGGGIGRYTDKLVRAVRDRQEVDLEVACLPEFAWRSGAPYPCWAGLRSISHPIAWRRRAKFLVGQFVNPVRLFRRAREVEAGIVHICNVNHLSFPFWRRAMEESGAKIVISVHDVRRAKGIVHHGWESAQLREIYRRADALIVHGESQRRDLLEYSECREERVHIVPHGTYDAPSASGSREQLRTSYGIAADRIVLLFFGNLRDDKNLDGMLEALAQHPDPRVLLLCAGRDGARGHKRYEHYRARIQTLGLHERVMIRDRFMTEQEVADLFTLSDLCVLPYKPEFTSQSGVLNTAAYYSLPVLATPCACLAEVMTKCRIGELCRDESPVAIAAGLTALLARLAAGDRFEFDQYRGHYSWEENARLTAAIYRDLLHDGTGTRLPSLSPSPQLVGTTKHV